LIFATIFIETGKFLPFFCHFTKVFEKPADNSPEGFFYSNVKTYYLRTLK